VIRDKLIELCCGDAQAVNLIEDFWFFMEAWDDVIDRDKPPDDDAVNRAMQWALLWSRDDPFLTRHYLSLRPAMQQAVVSWLTANRFERSGKRDLVEQAYFLRCAPYDFFATVVLLAGGQDQHVKAVEYFRALAPEDTLADYMREHLGD
jgi:hypothetical protein